MRAVVHLLLLAAFALPAHAEKVKFAKDRFSIEIPAEWKKGNGPDDGNILYRNAPDGNGTFSVYQLAVAKDHKANLQGTLESRVKALAKSGLVVTAEVKGKTQTFDGKPAVFGVIPVESKLGKDTIKFRYYLVLIDAKDTVVIMQAALPSPLPDKIRESALEIIQSFREKE